MYAAKPSIPKMEAKVAMYFLLGQSLLLHDSSGKYVNPVIKGVTPAVLPLTQIICVTNW